jgi:predicted DNA-binding transcriptional regulator YafY
VLPPTVERRDHRRRAEALARLVARLVRQRQGVTLRDLLAECGVSPRAARRMVKRLALRGLVQARAAGTWVATPMLLSPAPLVAVEVEG